MSLLQARDYYYFYWNTTEERVLCLLAGDGGGDGAVTRGPRAAQNPPAKMERRPLTRE